MNIPVEKLLDLYTMLSRIRRVELKIEELYHLDEMKTPIHSSLGEEAVSVGVCSNLQKEDYIFSNHRSHGHYLAKGGNLKAMIAELYCKETGCSRGRGGSMHLIDTSVGHMGSSSIVGGSIPHAVGAALASVMQNKNLVAVSFFGDAASEQGVFFESMSWAALRKLPVVFICENNFYSVCSHLTARQPNIDIYKRPRAFDIPSELVDGMNLAEVCEKAQKAIEHARSGQGPYFLECRVQRWRGHAGSGDPNKEKYRKPEDLDETNVRDPLKEFKEILFAGGVTESDLTQIDQKLDAEIQDAFECAQNDPLPNPEDLEKHLFC
ncbi:MAG: thiamine pyrophosphate-dependent dehydrogenase E1 component subunit alpha [Candidatus Omnitrophica bacterium]|nr:thiamine pyrophosphate-dependent dehydrogenase E1 component subunit alpha [Candidatus Omnitrophota bacterium]